MDTVHDAFHFSHLDGHVRVAVFLKIEKLFGITGSEHYSKSSRQLNKSPKMYFHIPCIDEVLGDLRLSQWPVTVRQKHDWILNNQEYLWQFMAGFFEGKGLISNPFLTKDHHFTIQAKDDAAIAALSELLSQLGFHDQSIKMRYGEQIAIQVYGIEEVQKLAFRVHSADHSKEKNLSEYRYLPGRVHKNTNILSLYYAVIKLRYEENKTYQEIADVPELQTLGLTYGMVKSWLSDKRHPYGSSDMNFDFAGRKNRREMKPDWREQRDQLMVAYTEAIKLIGETTSLYALQYIDRFADFVDHETNLALLSSMIINASRICHMRDQFTTDERLAKFCFDLIYAATPEELNQLYFQFTRGLIGRY